MCAYAKDGELGNVWKKCGNLPQKSGEDGCGMSGE